MNEATNEKAPLPALDEAEVAAYLEANPDFLQQHPAVLEQLELRHDAGSAVSLIERQIDALRHGNQQLQSKLSELIATARDNELRVQHLNALARTLIAADTAETLVSGLRDCLRRELAVDALFFGVVGGEEVAQGEIHTLATDGPQMRAVTNVFRRGKPLCGPLTREQADVLFADQGDTPPQSAAMVPLGEGQVKGVLVLGSRDSRRFVPDMGTLFLELMGELVTTAGRRHLGANKL